VQTKAESSEQARVQTKATMLETEEDAAYMIKHAYIQRERYGCRHKQARRAATRAKCERSIAFLASIEHACTMV
jgi:hypothetical protein